MQKKKKKIYNLRKGTLESINQVVSIIASLAYQKRAHLHYLLSLDTHPGL